jgi:type IV secretion system protein VirB6
MPVAAAGAAGIIVAIAEAIGDTSADPGNVATVSLILPFLVILILSAGIMASVPYIASNLTGVMGIASNAIGLTGLARRGMVNSGMHSANSMTRISTGKSPQEIKRGLNDSLSSVGSSVRQSPAAALTAIKSLRKP